MNRRLFPVWLEQRATRERVKALISRASIHDVLAWADWQFPADAEDHEWDWVTFFTDSLQEPTRYECYSTFAAGDVQGLMRLDLGAPDHPQPRFVTVDYLTTNPANRDRNSGLKFIGVALMAVAVMRSLVLGRRGRIVLESLPGAEPFYRSLGMRKLRRTSPDGYSIFTLNEKAARQLLDEIRKKRIIVM
jgi:hypothetical protein